MGRKHRSGISERKIIILPDSEGPKRKPDFEHEGFRKCSVLPGAETFCLEENVME